MILALLLMLAVILLDAASKILVARLLPLGESVDVISGVFRLTNVSNAGMAFGLLADSRWVFLLLSAALIVCLLVFLIRQRTGYAATVYISVGMIAGGGIGNLIDRFYSYGVYDLPSAVVDYFDFCAFPELWMWTFNVADAFVCVGAAIMLIYLLFLEKAAVKKGKKPLFAEEKRDGYQR